MLGKVIGVLLIWVFVAMVSIAFFNNAILLIGLAIVMNISMFGVILYFALSLILDNDNEED